VDDLNLQFKHCWLEVLRTTPQTSLLVNKNRNIS
jgi:hypothetical protein